MRDNTTMTDRLVEVVQKHDRNPINTVGALLSVAALMATRVRITKADWDRSCHRCWEAHQAKWAEYDESKGQA